MIVGIDVSKDKLDVHILSNNKHYQIKNSTASIASFIKNKLNDIGSLQLIIFEATGGYEKLLQSYLIQHELPYHRAHPTRVRRFAESRGYFAKNDRIDALILAEYAQQLEIQANGIENESLLILQEYSSRKQQLKDMIASEKQRMKIPYLAQVVKRSIRRSIKRLEDELIVISTALNQLIEADELLKRKHELLKTAKGIGDEVATMLVTDLPELGHMSREAISHLVGVAPQTQDSGKKTGYRGLSAKGASTCEKFYLWPPW